MDYLVEQGQVTPSISVVVPSFAAGGYNALVGTARRDVYVKTFADELIPFIARELRTIKSREGRANYGTGRGGFMATYASFEGPDLFSEIAPSSRPTGTRQTTLNRLSSSRRRLHGHPTVST